MTSSKKSLIFRIKNKYRKIKAKRDSEKGFNHKEGWSKEKVQDYWKNEANKDENNPKTYIDAQNNRAEYFFELIKNKLNLKINEPILELGTNAGKVLNHLFSQGFQNITGIEINSNAINIMKKEYPNAHNNSNIINASLEDSLPQFKDNSFSLVFSIYVLFTIHPENNFIFEHIARISKKFIITIEAEDMVTKRCYPRNMKKIFEKLGFKEIFFEMTEGKIDNYPNLHCRIFKKISS